MEIKIFERAGAFAENKDVARNIRLNEIMPALNRNEEVILDFIKVDSTTQSFIHALISQIIRDKKIGILDELKFKNCNLTVQRVIEIVTEYMQKGD
jgi:hypothetical protein